MRGIEQTLQYRGIDGIAHEVAHVAALVDRAINRVAVGFVKGFAIEQSGREGRVGGPVSMHVSRDNRADAIYSLAGCIALRPRG